MSHTSYLQPAAGWRVQEAAGHGAAQLSLARFGCLRWHRARGTGWGKAHLSHAGAAALPGGQRLCRAAHILDMRLQFWMRLLRDQIYYWPLAALMVQNSHKYTQKDCSRLVCFASGRAAQETGPGLSLLPHDTPCPQKFGPKRSKARGSFDVKARLAIATRDELQALEKTLPPAKAETSGFHL